jgi:hypothetical protein
MIKPLSILLQFCFQTQLAPLQLGGFSCYESFSQNIAADDSFRGLILQ